MIEIEAGPNLFSTGTFMLSWHGFFSFVAVATAVFLVGRWAPLKNIDADDIYAIAIWAIIGGILGARIVHVIDQLGFYLDNPIQILYIWRGGIGLRGGILGGFIGGVAYALIHDKPVGIIADLTAPAMLIAQSIGRLGDIVNGEHCAKAASDFIFGFAWINPASVARICPNGVGIPVHPVIVYEIAWNLMSLLLVWKLRNKIMPDGMLFALYLALYATGRFFITFLREDRLWFFGLQEAQYIALLVLIITVPLLIIKARFRTNGELQSSDDRSRVGLPELPFRRGTRAQRRRRN